MKKERKVFLNVSKNMIGVSLIELLSIIPVFIFLKAEFFTNYFYAYFIIFILLKKLNFVVIDTLARAEAKKSQRANILLSGMRRLFFNSLLTGAVVILLAPILSNLLRGDASAVFSFRLFAIILMAVPILRLLYLSLAQNKSKQYWLYFLERLLVFIAYLIYAKLLSSRALSLDYSLVLVVIANILAPLLIFIILRYKPKKKRTKKTLKNEESYYFEDLKTSLTLDVYKNIFIVIDTFLIAIVLRKYNYSQAFIDETLLSHSLLAYHIFILISVIISILITNNIKTIKASIKSGDKSRLKTNIDLVLRKTIFFLLPIVMIVAFTSEEIWLLFFKNGVVGADVLKIASLAMISLLLNVSAFIVLLQVRDTGELKKAISLSLFIKLLILFVSIQAFRIMGFTEYYGIIVSSLIAQFFSLFLAFKYLAKKYKINFEKTIQFILDNIFVAIIISVLIFIIRLYIDVELVGSDALVLLIISLLITVSYWFLSSKIGFQKTLIQRR